MVKINSNTKHHINRKIFNNKIFNRNIFSPRTINNEIAFDNRALSTELNTKLANTKIPNTKQSKISINVIFSISVTIVAVLVFFLLFFSQARVTNNLYCRTLLMFKTHNFENSLNPQLLECAKSIFSTPLVNEEIAYTNYFNGNKQKQLFTLVNHYQKDLTFTLPDNAIIESVVLNLSSESIIEPIRDYPTEVSAYLNDNGNISVPLKIRKSVDYFRNLSFVIVGSNRTKKLNVYFVYDPTASMAADINYTCDMIKKIQQHREIADVINATLWFSGTKPSFFDSTTKNNNPCYNISYRIINSSITNTYKDSSITLKDFTYSHVPGSVCYYTMYAFDSADEAWCYNSITLINYLKAIHQLNPTSYNKMPIKVAIVPVSDTAPTGGGSRYYFLSKYKSVLALPIPPFTSNDKQCIFHLTDIVRRNNVFMDYVYGIDGGSGEGFNIGDVPQGATNRLRCYNKTYQIVGAVNGKCGRTLYNPSHYENTDYCEQIHSWVNSLLSVSHGKSFQLLERNNDDVIKGIADSIITHFPKNVYVYLLEELNDGSYQRFVLWHYKNRVDKSYNVNLNKERRKDLLNFIKKCKEDSSGFCSDIRLVINTSKSGVIYLDGLNINGISYIRGMGFNLTEIENNPNGNPQTNVILNKKIKDNVNVFENLTQVLLLDDMVKKVYFESNKTYMLRFYGNTDYSNLLVDGLNIEYKYAPLYSTLAHLIVDCWKRSGYGAFVNSQICGGISIPITYKFARNLSKDSFIDYVKRLNGCSLIQDSDVGCGSKNMLNFTVNTNRSMNLLVWYDGTSHRVVVS